MTFKKYLSMIFIFNFVVLGAKAQTRSLICSNAKSSVRMSVYEPGSQANASLHKEKVILKTATLGGIQEVELNLDKLQLLLSNRVDLENESHSAETYCGVPRKTMIHRYVEKALISKKDGSFLYEKDVLDDSPTSLSELLLCEETTVDPWPCP